MRAASGPWSGATRPRMAADGSAVLLALFVCLAVASVVQVLAVVVMCGARAVGDESVGREQLAQRDEGLARLRAAALETWREMPWASLGEAASHTYGQLSQIEGSEECSEEWVLAAGVRHNPTVTLATTSAWLERGRDGLDLPYAALVATQVLVAVERASQWLGIEEAYAEDGAGGEGGGGASEAVAYVLRLPESRQIEEGCSLVEMKEPWELDDGWRALFKSPLPLGPRVRLMSGEEGDTILLPADLAASSVDDPVLVVVLGGADLDARAAGDVHGVLVVDGGSALLDGTILHGAAFVGDCIDFGLNGRLEFCDPVLRWATDRSLQRVRLVPGTRREGTG
jgi:hypothetical protein